MPNGPQGKTTAAIHGISVAQDETGAGRPKATRAGVSKDRKDQVAGAASSAGGTIAVHELSGS